MRSTATTSAVPAAADVDLDAPVGAIRRPPRRRGARSGGDRIGERGPAERTGRPGRSTSVGTGPGAGRSRRCAMLSSAVGGAERIRGVADGPVSGAPAQVSAERVKVEAVRTVLIVRPPSLRRPPPDRGGRTPTPCCRRNPACSTRICEPPRACHLLLNRMQASGRAEALRGEDLLTVQRGDRDQAGIDCGPLRAAIGVRLRDQDRATRRIPLRRTLLCSRSGRSRAANRAWWRVPPPGRAHAPAR